MTLQGLTAQKPDLDHIPENIKDAVDIYGVEWNYVGWVGWGSVEMWPSNSSWHPITEYSKFTIVPATTAITAYADPDSPWPTTSTTKHVLAYAWTYTLHLAMVFYTPTTIEWYVDIMINWISSHYTARNGNSYVFSDWIPATLSPWDEITVVACWTSGYNNSYVSISVDIWAWFRINPQPDTTWFVTTVPV